jgi:hypothetical protein
VEGLLAAFAAAAGPGEQPAGPAAD